MDIVNAQRQVREIRSHERRGVPPVKDVSSVIPKIRFAMATKKPFPQAGFVNYLEHLDRSAPLVADAQLSSHLVSMLFASDGTGALTKGGGHLIPLLNAHKAMLQASFDTELVADELRRYQKFAKPGQPSPHIVQLRQGQAAAAFARDAGIEVPERVGLEVFITRWIDANVPKGFVPLA